MNFLRNTSTFVALFLFVGFSNANLLINGGFEANELNENSWRAYAPADIQGWDGTRIELWRSFSGVDAYEGFNHAELNADPGTGSPFVIFQSFGTSIGSEYEFSFAYQARDNNDEAFRVDIESGSENVFSQVIDDHIVGSWSLFTDVFVATDMYTTISFSTVSPETSTIGNFIDAVSVIDADEVSVVEASAPASIAILSLGLVLLAASKRKR
jgi:hypothetical protein